MIRVFPRRTKWSPTDELAFFGPPQLFRPGDEATPVFVSCVFTWDIPRARWLAEQWDAFYKDVRLGGPAFGTAAGEFHPGVFLKPGVTITSRGCPNRCPWCLVPEREGAIRELPIWDGWIVQDNNLLACSRPHIEAVAEMLRRQPRAAIFSGGLEAELLEDWHRELFDGLRVRELWFACDSQGGVSHLERASRILDGIPQRKLRAYVLMGFGEETLAEAERRVERVFELGFLPFAQLYRGPGERDYSPEWKALARKWSRPAAYRGTKYDD